MQVQTVEADSTTTTTETRFIHGPGIDEPLAMVRDGQNYFYHADGLGSVVAITDQSQNIVQKYSYETFGLPTPSDPSFRQPYAFTAREWDRETGLYFYRARYYDPMEGRFISKDPIGFAGGDVNVYGYVLNNSINLVDPDGLDFKSSFSSNWKKTNKFFFSGTTKATRTVVGLTTSGGVARTFGTVTLFQAIRSLPAGGVATLGVGGTLGSAALNTGINGLLSGLALETPESVRIQS